MQVFLPHSRLQPTPGRLELIIGCMFSGKSTELLRRVRVYTLARQNCLVIKYAKDVRYVETATHVDASECVVTHDSISQQAIAVMRLADVPYAAVSQATVIAIDEGQFYADIEEYANKWASQNKIVLVAALDSTFARLPFQSITNLVAQAESVQKLVAVCATCGSTATYSARTSDETALEVIGGSDKYVALCRACFDASMTTKKVTKK